MNRNTLSAALLRNPPSSPPNAALNKARIVTLPQRNDPVGAQINQTSDLRTYRNNGFAADRHTDQGNRVPL